MHLYRLGEDQYCFFFPTLFLYLEATSGDHVILLDCPCFHYPHLLAGQQSVRRVSKTVLSKFYISVFVMRKPEADQASFDFHSKLHSGSQANA